MLARGAEMRRLLVGLLIASSLHAENRFWKWSTAALLAGTSADMASSYGHRELNPLLAGQDGRFGGRGVVIKAGMAGGVILFQWIVLRRNPRASKVFGIANIGAGAAFGSVASRNVRVK